MKLSQKQLRAFIKEAIEGQDPSYFLELVEEIYMKTRGLVVGVQTDYQIVDDENRSVNAAVQKTLQAVTELRRVAKEVQASKKNNF